MDRPDFIAVVGQAAAIVLLESASPLEEAILLEACDDSSPTRLLPMTLPERILARDRRCRGLAVAASPGTLAIASTAAPDPALVAFLAPPPGDGRSPALDVLALPWLAARTQAASPASLTRLAGGDATDHGLPSLFPANNAGRPLVVEEVVPAAAAAAAAAAPTSGAALDTPLSAELARHLRAMEAGLRRQVREVEAGLHQRLDRLEMVLGLLLQEQQRHRGADATANAPGSAS